MADLSDVTSYIYNQCIAAVYPNGTGAPSVAPIFVGYTKPMDIRVFEGWPISDQLDRDLGGTMLQGSPGVGSTPVPRPNGPVANVSIFPLAGTGTATYQVLDKTHVITPATFGLTVTSVDDTIVISGNPNTGEFVSIIVNRKIFILRRRVERRRNSISFISGYTNRFPSGFFGCSVQYDNYSRHILSDSSTGRRRPSWQSYSSAVPICHGYGVGT